MAVDESHSSPPNTYNAWRENGNRKLVRSQLRFLKRSNGWSRDQLESWQLQRLGSLLSHCVRNVPFYSRSKDYVKLEAAGVSTLECLRDLPFVTKSMIKDDPEAFWDFSYTGTPRSITSGGSTGDPLEVRFDELALARDRAVTHFYLWLRGHHPLRSRSVRIHGDVLPDSLTGGQVFWQAVSSRKLIMSNQHIDSRTVKAYIDQIDRWRADYIHAFPSSIYHLVKTAREMGFGLRSRVPFVYLDSENLYPGQRALIEEFFGGTVCHIYGHTEAAVAGIPFPGSNDFHLLSQVGLVNLASGGDYLRWEPGAKGELVVTGLSNWSFPLIQYRTSDWGLVSDDVGHQDRYPKLASLEGRDQDFAQSKTGRHIPLAPLLFDYNVDWSDVRRFQVVQKSKGSLFVMIEFEDKTFDRSQALNRLGEQLHHLFGAEFDLHLEVVDAISQTSRGKFRYFISQL